MPGPRFRALITRHWPALHPIVVLATFDLTGAAAYQHRLFFRKRSTREMSRQADRGSGGDGNPRGVAGTTSGRKVTGMQVPALEYPSPNQEDTLRQRCLIVFIPGNPGLIRYYDPFLSTLRALLDEAESRQGSTTSFHLYGQNLLGFSDTDHSPPFSPSAPPFTLEDQINHLSARLAEKSTLRLASGLTTPFDRVLLIGHSVGAYIAVEVFHRHHLQSTRSSTPAPNLHTGILLFPAISHIARSPNGQILDRVRATPILDQWAHRVGRALVAPFPESWLAWICRVVLRQSDHAAAATAEFLASRDGIWQALHLGKDEMASITEDRWSEDLWEHRVPREGGGDKFFFYFGTRDRWVDDVSRDEFVAARKAGASGGGGGVKVVMDEGGIPHAFCIHYSEEVASKVMGWIEESNR